MKIIQLIMANQLRGAELFTCQLSNHLLLKGHQVKILALKQGAADLPFNGDCVILSKKKSIRFIDLKRMKALAEIIKTERPDLIQANAGDTVRIAVFSKLLYRWKTPLVFRNASTVSLYIKQKIVKWFYSFLYRYVDHIISVSEESRHDFIKTFPKVAGKITTIHIGIELNEIAGFKPDHHSTRDYLVHVGGFSFEKNHVGLLRIFKMILTAHPAMELWLIGDGPLRYRVEQNIAQMALGSKVKVLGYRPDAINYIASAKALLLPSIIEGLPAVILEAMFVKTPVVAYDVGGISEVIQHKRTGWLVEVNDEDAFVSSVGEILCGTSDIRIVTEHAFNIVTKKFSNTEIAERFLKIYENVLGRSSSNGS